MSTQPDIWVKAACAAFVLLTTLAGWGLKKTYEIDIKITRVETKLDIWTTPLPRPSPVGVSEDERTYGPKGNVQFVAMPYKQQQSIDFSQKAMVRAADQILQKDLDGAVKTLVIGLEGTGLSCTIASDHLECR